ncbi:thiamine-phosphate kinase [Thermocrinis minervae]|uniref:Thiamine-monophosphate kinase n=1 Tax=Thermocrinis minervae TaxID=381751 RepID=A0A1M6Q7L9_9AQUI|nr:thiamine-phosphate kinase [Thermocrinis minervae]SHK16148.1 thiamine-phosphate kinase [Thermocrinis minervae]
MRISELGEFGLIERLKNLLGENIIGDDTACVSLGDVNLLLTCDLLLEDRHFKSFFPPASLGWKAISVNVSDVCANGGTPKWALVSLMVPDFEVSYIEELYEGIKRACEFYGCRVVGGNVSRSDKVGIDVFMVGIAQRFVGRSTAKVGDGVFVSGTLGDSRAGLELLLMQKDYYESFELRLIERHLRPTARIDYVKHITKYANASIDISDGLSSELWHISKRSGVKIVVEKRRIPLSKELLLFCEKYGKDPYDYALNGGEDYQLLFTHPVHRQNPFLDMTQIGVVEEGQGVFIDGEPLKAQGYKHFG